MTTKKDWNPQKHKKIFFVAITIFAVLIITSIIIILQQKEETEEFEYCNMTFLSKEQSELCKKKSKENWHPYTIDCMPCISSPETTEYCQKKSELCEKARKAWYPYITY